MKPLCIAHRGRHNVHYENTKGAFTDAVNGDFFGVETDIQFTKDGIAVLHHNDDIVSNGKSYLIRDCIYEEIRNLPLDNQQNDKEAFAPLLSDYLNILKNSGKRPVIEFKNSPKWAYIKSALQQIDSVIGLSNVTIIAFYPWPLLKIKFLSGKKIHMQQLIGDQHTDFILKMAKMMRLDIDMDYHLLTQEIVEDVHKRKRKVNVWTVDDAETLCKVCDMGVDYVTTNVFTQES